MRKTFLTLLSVVAMTMSAQYKSQVWSPDNGDGTFTNPVINCFLFDIDFFFWLKIGLFLTDN